MGRAVESADCQVALIAYMAQIGSFVPAEYAKIGIVDKSEVLHATLLILVFTRLQTRESVSKVYKGYKVELITDGIGLHDRSRTGVACSSRRNAAFVDHPRRVRQRCIYAQNQLIIGTTAADGAGLLAGVIDHLIKGPCPRTIILTHFQ